MIWHIFKKDLRLMWPFVVGLTILAAIQCALEAAAGTVIPQGLVDLLLQFLPIVMMLSIAVITVMVVQQDNLLGDRQDWLLRPIPSHSVLAAKLLFVLLVIHAPLLVIDVLEVTLTGISARQSLIPALSHQLVLFVLITAPAVMVGASTRNVVTALGFCLGAFIVLVSIFFVANSGWAMINPSGAPLESGYAWVVAWTTFLIYAATIICLARFQFRERREIRSRILALTVTAAGIALLCGFPWGPAIKAQQWIDAGPAGGTGLALSFSPAPLPQSGPPTEGHNGVLSTFKAGRDLNILDFVSGIHQVTLPVQITGLSPGDVMVSDRGTFQVQSPNGTKIFATDGAICTHLDRGGVRGTRCFFAELRGHRGSTDTNVVIGEMLLPLPTAVYKQVKDQPVRITVDFTLTRLRHIGSQFMHAANDRKMLGGIGLCTTEVDRDGDDIQWRCVTAIRQPTCIGATLTDLRTAARNPVLFGCDLDYAPFPANWIPPTLLKRGGADLPFLDLDGLAHYPVSTSQIGEAQVVIDTFVPGAHLNRSLKIPAIRLGDWESQAAKPGA